MRATQRRQRVAPIAVAVLVAVAGALEASGEVGQAVGIAAALAGRPPDAVSIAVAIPGAQVTVTVVVSHIAAAVQEIAVAHSVRHPQVPVSIVIADVRHVLAIEVAVADAIHKADIVVAVAVASVGAVCVAVAVGDAVVQPGVAVAIGIAGSLRRAAHKSAMPWARRAHMSGGFRLPQLGRTCTRGPPMMSVWEAGPTGSPRC